MIERRICLTSEFFSSTKWISVRILYAHCSAWIAALFLIDRETFPICLAAVPLAPKFVLISFTNVVDSNLDIRNIDWYISQKPKRTREQFFNNDQYDYIISNTKMITDALGNFQIQFSIQFR